MYVCTSFQTKIMHSAQPKHLLVNLCCIFSSFLVAAISHIFFTMTLTGDGNWDPPKKINNAHTVS